VTTPSRPNGRDWFNGIVAGVALGAVFLGLGGRAGMRIIAIVNDQAPLFSVEGSIAVLLLGAGNGRGHRGDLSRRTNSLPTPPLPPGRLLPARGRRPGAAWPEAAELCQRHSVRTTLPAVRRPSSVVLVPNPPSAT